MHGDDACIVWALRASMSGWQLYIIIIIITHYLLFIYLGAVRLNFAYSYIKLCSRLAAHYAPVVLVTLLNHHTLGTCLVSNPGFCSRVEFTARWTANCDRLWLGCGVRGQHTQAWQVTGPRIVRSKATANDYIIWMKADTTATTKQQHKLHLRRHFVNVYILHIRKFARTCLNGGYRFLTPSQP